MIVSAPTSRHQGDADENAAAALRPCIVTPNCSLRMGGEAALPYHFFRVLRARGEDVRLITHARNRDELTADWPDQAERIFYASDDWVHRLLYRAGHVLPNRLSRATFGMAAEFYTERQQRRILRRLIARGLVDLVHKPIPVSPVQPSIFHRLGVPVIFGPLNGGMDFPPAFSRHENRLERIVVGLGRRFGGVVNRIFPGKRRAAFVLVANRRTREALPAGVKQRPVIELPENGVDLPLWNSRSTKAAAASDSARPLRFAFLGRLVDWKAVDLLLEAWAKVISRGGANMILEVIGDGPELPRLKDQAARLGLSTSVEFAGWQPQPEAAKRLAAADALVLPSLLECGGAVVLEAMAAGLPVIAAAWGGPKDYLDETCGILVEPKDREAFINGFAEGIERLAGSAELRRQLGDAGRLRVAEFYDWQRKGEQILHIYQRAVKSGGISTGDDHAATAVISQQPAL